MPNSPDNQTFGIILTRFSQMKLIPPGDILHLRYFTDIKSEPENVKASTKHMSTQRRHRSACASAQFDQSVCCAFENNFSLLHSVSGSGYGLRTPWSFLLTFLWTTAENKRLFDSSRYRFGMFILFHRTQAIVETREWQIRTFSLKERSKSAYVYGSDDFLVCFRISRYISDRDIKAQRVFIRCVSWQFIL